MTRIIDADELKFTTIWNDDGTEYAEYILKDDIMKARKYRPEVVLIDQPVTRVLVHGKDYTKVVRCSNCEWRGTEDCPVDRLKNDTDYCSWGERETDE